MHMSLLSETLCFCADSVFRHSSLFSVDDSKYPVGFRPKISLLIKNVQTIGKSYTS
jgi:hypothetical protein